MEDETPTGIDVPAVTAWLVDHLEGAEAPFRFEQIPGGSSNLTFRLADAAGHTWVLRRPPVNSVLASAHDMTREFTAMSALGPTPVPVPATHVICEDPTVTGATFYVMGLVPGIQMEDAEGGAQLEPPARARAATTFVDALAALHAVDPDAVGLGQLGKRTGYVERQLRRWNHQWEQSRVEDRPVVRAVHERLLAIIPEQQGGATVVHGDYSFRNCRFALDGELGAVLDWEICTLGDPLADLGYVLAAWEPADPESLVGLAGFPTADEVVARYVAATGYDPSPLPFYLAFNHWKSVCIVEGVYARYLAGALGADRAGEAERFGPLIERRTERAVAHLDALSGGGG